MKLYVLCFNYKLNFRLLKKFLVRGLIKKYINTKEINTRLS